jgi:PAS domain S-box-containing protein
MNAVNPASHAGSHATSLARGTLITTLMRTALAHAGAERGLLILLRDGEPRIAAEATTAPGSEVALRERVVSHRDLPGSALHYVIRTREALILDDEATDSLLCEDEYLARHRPRSALCLPVRSPARLLGALYLENNLAAGDLAPERIAVLELLAAQAAISLENARLHSDLQRSAAFLAEGERLSHTGSWHWDVPSGQLVWSDEHCRIFGYDPEQVPPPTLRWFLERVHAEDRPLVAASLQSAIRDRAAFALDFRVVLPDGSVRHLHGVGRPVIGESGTIDAYIGSTTDVSEQKQREAALARAARLASLGELAPMIAHEVTQPLMAIVTNADACLSWLSKPAPNLDEARQAAERIVRNGHRAGAIVKSVRAMTGNAEPDMAPLDINDAIREILVLLGGELARHDVTLETDLATTLAPVIGDRVQLQQVMLNLVMNGVQAMRTITDRPRTLRVSTEPDTSAAARVAVTDTGTGLDPATTARLFDRFFTTRQGGTGMGLAICRAIVEAHGGQIDAAPHHPHGSIFRFTLPQTTALTIKPDDRTIKMVTSTPPGNDPFRIRVRAPSAAA